MLNFLATPWQWYQDWRWSRRREKEIEEIENRLSKLGNSHEDGITKWELEKRLIELKKE